MSFRFPSVPLLYSKTGVYRGIHLFLIFALKHRLWVLVRTASLIEAVLTCTHNYVLSKNKTFFHLKIIIFTALKSRSISHGHVFVIIVLTRLCNLDSLRSHFYIVEIELTGKYVHYVSCFCPKHILCVLVRTASVRTV